MIDCRIFCSIGCNTGLYCNRRIKGKFVFHGYAVYEVGLLSELGESKLEYQLVY